MAKLVPEEVTGTSQCKSQKVSLSSADGEEEGAGGCGTSGRSSGGEMAEMEKSLQQDEEASGREVDVASLISSDTSDHRHGRIEAKGGKTGKKLVRQNLGTCTRCGYMSSQAICKACVLLEGLNKNRPKVEIEIDVEDDQSSTLRRRMEGIALPAA